MDQKHKEEFRKCAEEITQKMTLAEKMSQMCYDAPAIERLGIPSYNWWNESLHGAARAGTATVFPQAIALAASFDDVLIEKVADAISDEVRAKYNEYRKYPDTLIYQGITCWAPNINIFRDPRWGRGHETYGEDPYLTSRMGAAYIKGMQGYGKYWKVAAALKHYAVHSGPESVRHGFQAYVSEKDLNETYLKAFEYCIREADPAGVMLAYNAINGEPCCASETYLTRKLLDEFNFKGYVVSDCGAICDLHQYFGITKNAAESAAIAVKSGCHLNCGTAYQHLKTAMAMGILQEEDITEAVVRLFETRFKLGMFAEDCEYDHLSIDIVECKEHRILNKKMCTEGIVLLKNDGILPIDLNISSIAVIGPNADSIDVLLGNYHGTPSYYTTFLKGIQTVCDENNIKLYYAKGCDLLDAPIGEWAEQPLREAVLAAARADVTVVIGGLSPKIEGEQGDEYNGELSGDKPNIELPVVQKELYRNICNVAKSIVYVNVSGSCLNLFEYDKSANGIIQCFYPGAEGGNALADILFGKVSPSGRLPVTFYQTIEDIPDFSDYSMENRTYRFYKGKPLYRFGYGLTYGDVKENWIDEKTVQVENCGKMGTDYSILRFNKNPFELVDFKRIFIQAGEKKIVHF